MTDLTIANDGTVDPRDPAATLSDLSDVAGVYYGVGDGTFRFAFDPGYASLSEGYWVPWAGEISGTTTVPAQLWAGTLPWTYADVDRDGEPEAVSAGSLGLPYEELSYLGACSNFVVDGGEVAVVLSPARGRGEHQGDRPVRERSGPPEGMKGQTRPTEATTV